MAQFAGYSLEDGPRTMKTSRTLRISLKFDALTVISRNLFGILGFNFHSQ